MNNSINYVINKKSFDDQAEIYNSTNTVHYSGNAKKGCVYVADIVKDTEFNSMLDVGCGTGYMFTKLDIDKNKKYIGIDFSEKMLEVAKKYNPDNIDFVIANAENLPFDDNSVDLITCVHSFQFYENLDKSFKEMYRVLKPGGKCIISDAGLNGTIGRFCCKMIEIFFKNKLWFYNGIHRVEGRGMTKRRLKKAGFTVNKSRLHDAFLYTIIMTK